MRDITDIGELRLEVIKNKIEYFINNHYKCYPIILEYENEKDKGPENKNYRNYLENILYDLPLHQISDYINQNLLSTLHLGNLKIIGDTELIFHYYEQLNYSEDQIINFFLEILEKRVIELIRFGKLNSELYINDQKLCEVIDFIPANKIAKILKIIFYKNLLIEGTLNDELTDLFSNFSQNQHFIFQKYYLENKSISSIAKEIGITSQGVKNHLFYIPRNIDSVIRMKPFINFRMASFVARDLGLKLNYNSWKEELIKLGILVNNNILNDVDPFNLYVSILTIGKIQRYLRMIPRDDLELINSLSDQKISN